MRASFDEKVVLGAILVLALVLRIIGLNAPLWYDELNTLYSHIRLPWSDMMSGYEMNHHYLFSFQAKLSAALFGEAPWSLRLPAVVFGVGSIAAIWVLVRDVSNAKFAHVTALLLALSYHHIWFSQNARGYTELMFWCTVGLILFLRGVANNRLLTWLWFGVVLALSVFTHLTGFFFFFAVGVVWVLWAVLDLIRGKTGIANLWPPALGFIVGGVLCLLMYAPVLDGVVQNAADVGGTSKVDVMQEFQNPIWTILEAIRTVASGLGPLIGLAAILTIGLSLLGAVKVWSKAPLFPVIVFAHIVLTMALLYALGMRIWPRFFFVDIGFLLALIVLGVAQTCKLVERALPGLNARMTYALGIAGMIVISVALAAQNYRAPKQDVAGAQALIEAEAQDGDRILATGFVGELFVKDLKTGWDLVMDNAELSQAMAQDGRKWIVVGFPARTFRAIDDLEGVVAGFELVKRFPGTLGDGAMLVFAEPLE